TSKEQVRQRARSRYQREAQGQYSAAQRPPPHDPDQQPAECRSCGGRGRLGASPGQFRRAQDLCAASALRAASTRPAASNAPDCSSTQRSTTGASAVLKASISSCVSTTCSLPLSVAILMPKSSAPRQICATSRSQSSPLCLV